LEVVTAEGLAELHFMALTSQRTKLNAKDHHEERAELLFVDVRSFQREAERTRKSFEKSASNKSAFHFRSATGLQAISLYRQATVTTDNAAIH
jgi:hypothetical protein